MSKTRVLLADDHDLFREGLASILDAQPDFEVVGEAADGLEVIVMAHKLQPDMILMDIGMPGCDGVEATRRIKQEQPRIIIVMLTVRDEDDKLFDAIKSGAQGYLLKSIRSRGLLAMLRGAVQGYAAVTPVLSSRMLDEFRRMGRLLPETTSNGSDDEPPRLTPREREVLNLAAQGLSDQEIANELVISIHTAKSHMRNVLAKLHAGHRQEAASFARSHGLIPPDTFPNSSDR